MNSDRKLVITEYQKRKIAVLFENQKEQEIHVLDEKSLVGNIYVGKIKNILENIHAAFVEFLPGQIAFLNLDKYPIHFLNTKKNEKACVGDDVLIQFVKPGIKTKLPEVTSDLSLAGDYVVVHTGNDVFAVSSKIQNASLRMQLKAMKEQYRYPFGIVFRTLCEQADTTLIENECQMLSEQMQELIKKASFRESRTLLYKIENESVDFIKHYFSKEIEIVTDDKNIYDNIMKMIEKSSGNKILLRYYDDPSYSLTSCYGIHTIFEKALNEKVWLNSGGYLVIEQTEALSVIDVNSGKNIRSGKQNAALKQNKEAVIEIGRQLRLRNLSGIIIIDFINMDSKADEKELCELLMQVIAMDSVKTCFVDMTKLGLVELTRKKTGKSLKQQMALMN